MREIGLTGVNPVSVAAECIDLPVVGDHAERVGEGPSGKSVGAIALMKNREGSFIARVLQIEVETLELSAREHSFVDDDARAEGGNVEGGGSIGRAPVLDFIP